MSELVEIARMDGYAFYVWTSLAVFLVLMLLDWVLPVLERKRTLRAIALRDARARRKETT